VTPDPALDDGRMSDSGATGPRIVVGTDGSNHAATTVRWAADEAVRRGAALDVIHAWLPPYPIGPTDLYHLDEPAQRAAETLVNATVERLRQEVPGLVEVRASAPMEHPAPALLHAAEGAELLVVGPRGRRGFAGLLLGSVSERCLTHSTCPVAIVPAMADIPGGRVVVGVDGSAASAVALAWAAREASLRWARLHVVHAWMPGVEGVDASEQASRALLEAMVDGLENERDSGLPDPMLQSVAGPAVPALMQCAAQAELLVLGARGAGGFRGVLLGSVSRHCAPRPACPTVVVRGMSRREHAMASAAREAHEP
jgi:nucleotide-binding universal stress UspA family protein